MSTTSTHGGNRRVVVIVIAVVALVVAAVAAVAVAVGARGGSGSDAPNRSTAAQATQSTAPTPAPVPSSSTAPTPQPTRTTAISETATIGRSLTATVVKQDAVEGTASGPGEVAGPSVRFTITITNGTTKAVDLSNTVVNAYFGAAKDPALALENPGGKPFPQSVAAGATATGAFVFTIPQAQRSDVEVTVDTSVDNPVVAFQGAAPSQG